MFTCLCKLLTVNSRYCLHIVIRDLRKLSSQIGGQAELIGYSSQLVTTTLGKYYIRSAYLLPGKKYIQILRLEKSFNWQSNSRISWFLYSNVSASWSPDLWYFLWLTSAEDAHLAEDAHAATISSRAQTCGKDGNTFSRRMLACEMWRVAVITQRCCNIEQIQCELLMWVITGLNQIGSFPNAK